MTILVVEDDEDFRDVLQRICEEAEHDAVCVGTQQEALAAVTSRRFDLVLLDLGIPIRPGTSPRDWAGRAVLTHLRDAGDATPVIVITAQGKGYQLCREMLVDEKATDFVQKTLDGWQGPPLGEVIRRTLAASRVPAASATRPTAAVRVYPSTVRVHIDGRPTSKGYLVAVDDVELKVCRSPFDLLVQLAVGLLRGDEHEYVDLRKVANYHKRIQRVRDDLAKRKGVDALVLVEGDGQGRYRLSTAPSRVTADLANLKTYHDKLLLRLGGWPSFPG